MANEKTLTNEESIILGGIGVAVGASLGPAISTKVKPLHGAIAGGLAGLALGYLTDLLPSKPATP
jgi:hypothetical protein